MVEVFRISMVALFVRHFRPERRAVVRESGSRLPPLDYLQILSRLGLHLEGCELIPRPDVDVKRQRFLEEHRAMDETCASR